MAVADIAILAVIVLSAILGFLRGFVREVLSLATWLGAFVLALLFGPQLAAALSNDQSAGTVPLVIAYAAIFLSTLVGGGVAQWFIGQLVRGKVLSTANRTLGLLFGGARGALVCIIALIALRPFADETTWWTASRIRPPLLTFEAHVLGLFERGRAAVEESGVLSGG